MIRNEAQAEGSSDVLGDLFDMEEEDEVLGIRLEATAAPAGLPFTGADIARVLAAALALVGAGAVLLRLRRSA